MVTPNNHPIGYQKIERKTSFSSRKSSANRNISRLVYFVCSLYHILWLRHIANLKSKALLVTDEYNMTYTAERSHVFSYLVGSSDEP